MSVAYALPQPIKDILNDMGIEVQKIPKSFKRHIFSDISTSTKHRFKDLVIDTMSKYTDVTAAHLFSKLVLNTSELSETVLKNLGRNGIVLHKDKIPSSLRLSVGIMKVAESLCQNSISNDLSTRSAKKLIIAQTAKSAHFDETIEVMLKQ